GLRGFDRDPAFELGIPGFVNHAHATLGDGADDTEAAVEQLSRGEGLVSGQRRIERVEQEPVHLLLPIHQFPGFVEKPGVFRTGAVEVVFTLLGWSGQRQLHQIHYQVVILRFALHAWARWGRDLPDERRYAQTTICGLPPTCAAWSLVSCRGP